MSRRKKKKLPLIKKHFIIPLILGTIILLCGIIMTYAEQVGAGKSGGYRRIGQYLIPIRSQPEITGPGAIGLGSIIVILVFIYWYMKNKKNK